MSLVIFNVRLFLGRRYMGDIIGLFCVSVVTDAASAAPSRRNGPCLAHGKKKEEKKRFGRLVLADDTFGGDRRRRRYCW